MRFSFVVLAVFAALFTYVCAQEKVASNLKRYKHLRNWVQKAMKTDKMTSGRIQTWKYRRPKAENICQASCLQDDEKMLPQRLLDWFHVLKSRENKPDKRDTGFETSGCSSPAITWFFRQFDTNKDLVLDNSELAELEEIPYEHCMRKFLDKCDLNKDYKLNLKETCSCFKVQPPCSQDLKKVKDQGPMLGQFMPDCDDDGYYKPRQCHEQYCWCVDRYNQVVEGTKEKAWRVTKCLDNTDPNEVVFAGDDEAAGQDII